jgi:hypothetical protein
MVLQKKSKCFQVIVIRKLNLKAARMAVVELRTFTVHEIVKVSDLAIQEAGAHVCEEILEGGIDVAHLHVPGDGPIRIHH